MASLSASAENLTNSDTQSNDGSSMCLELALEGERLCKSGDCRAGVAFFQAAIQAGTDDLRTLSAIYSQLGNAFFYLGDYAKAMQYHKLDLTLARSMEDKLGEAKSSGNLGNTLKVMGRFDEAAICCDRHLQLARQLGDRLSEGRALYNLGNVYHAKGKHMGQTDPGDFGDDVKDALIKAVEFYQLNLVLMRDLGDRGAQGRACGNLGNTYYLLGDFEAAIENHQERLRIAREFGDKPAERRANSNLGNSHIFLGQFEQAAEHYKRTLSLAVDLNERAVEAQSCYSLGNTYTLLRDFSTAIDYHLRHLAIAQELDDKVGEARACWSLGNAHSSIGNHEKALKFAEIHYALAKELGDSIGESTARMNVSDLRHLLGLPEISDTDAVDIESLVSVDARSTSTKTSDNSNGSETSSVRHYRVRRQSMEQLDLIKLTPDGKRVPSHQKPTQEDIHENKAQVTKPTPKVMEEDFFDLLTRSQSKRMDDQRCSLKVMGTSMDGGGVRHKDSTKLRKPLMQQNSIPAPKSSAAVPKENRHALLEMIADLQSERMDEQRAQLPGLVVNRRGQQSTASTAASTSSSSSSSATAAVASNVSNAQKDNHPAPDDAFLDMLIRCQSSRLEEQRSELPRPSITMDVENSGETTTRRRARGGASGGSAGGGGVTVPDEDFFSLIMRVQGGRMEDQRAAVPPFRPPVQNNHSNNNNNNNNNNINNRSNNNNNSGMNFSKKQ